MFLFSFCSEKDAAHTIQLFVQNIIKSDFQEFSTFSGFESVHVFYFLSAAVMLWTSTLSLQLFHFMSFVPLNDFAYIS